MGSKLPDAMPSTRNGFSFVYRRCLHGPSYPLWEEVALTRLAQERETAIVFL